MASYSLDKIDIFDLEDMVRKYHSFYFMVEYRNCRKTNSILWKYISRFLYINLCNNNFQIAILTYNEVYILYLDDQTKILSRLEDVKLKYAIIKRGESWEIEPIDKVLLKAIQLKLPIY